MINKRIIDQLEQPMRTFRKQRGVILRNKQAGALSVLCSLTHSGDADRVL